MTRKPTIEDRLRARGVEPTRQAVAAYKVAVVIADGIAEKQAQAERDRELLDLEREYAEDWHTFDEMIDKREDCV